MNVKRLLSLLLCAILLFSNAVFASAEPTYPESDHDYADQQTRFWSYSLDDAPYGVLITFSEDTCFERGSSGKMGDYLAILDDNNTVLDYFTGTELAGAVIHLPCAGFQLGLLTDESVTAYGFRITDVRAATADDVYTVQCHMGLDGEDERTAYFSKITPEYSFFPTRFRQGCYLAGWAAEPDGAIRYTPRETPPQGTRELWAVWIELALGQDEVFPFVNEFYYFCVDGNDGYYMTTEDYRMMQRNLYRVFGASLYPTPIVSAVYATFPHWRWQGSCYGISTVTALQHFGKIDVLAQQGAATMQEMQPDSELISTINYYQTQTATSWLTENKAAVPGSLIYKKQLQALYDSVSDGNLVLFSYLKKLFKNGHSVLLTGAYTNEAGEHVLIAYDNNSLQTYHQAKYIDDLFVISADWSEIHCLQSRGEPLLMFQWTDRYEQFESFDRQGGGSVQAWYRAFFLHLTQLFRILFRR